MSQYCFPSFRRFKKCGPHGLALLDQTTSLCSSIFRLKPRATKAWIEFLSKKDIPMQDPPKATVCDTFEDSSVVTLSGHHGAKATLICRVVCIGVDGYRRLVKCQGETTPSTPVCVWLLSFPFPTVPRPCMRASSSFPRQ